MMVTISGGHAPLSSRGWRTEGGIVDVAVVRTSDRGTAKSSSSSAMSPVATMQQLLVENSQRPAGNIPAPLPAFSLLKSLNCTLGLKRVPSAAVNHSTNCALV